ncbi:MAG: hypothetical protein JST47_13010 [Bacteroidetes bacterium]|nr:hypothetical protein [Bacteroidota bacterium]MBS1974578.1 hypothetical protein [Bacteroidota bacterium]
MKTDKMKFLVACAAGILIVLLGFSCAKNKPSAGKPDRDTTIIVPQKDSIIYTDAIPDVPAINSSNDSGYLDLNNDGIVDFIFSLHYDRRLCSDDLLGLYGEYIYLNITPTDTGNSIRSDRSTALALDSFSVLALDSSWSNLSSVLVSGMVGGSARCILNTPHGGNWTYASGEFMGLKFRKNDNTYYGWARLTSTFHRGTRPPYFLKPGKLLLQDYAYNAIPGRPILTGQTH